MSGGVEAGGETLQNVPAKGPREPLHGPPAGKTRRRGPFVIIAGNAVNDISAGRWRPWAETPRHSSDRPRPRAPLPQLPRFLLALAALALFAATSARAQLTIEIVGGSGTAIPISIVSFENESSWPLGITGIVGADLTRSGLFRMVDDAGISPRPYRTEDVRTADFRARGADAVVVGSMRALGDGRAEVRFALVDTVRQAFSSRR